MSIMFHNMDNYTIYYTFMIKLLAIVYIYDTDTLEYSYITL